MESGIVFADSRINNNSASYIQGIADGRNNFITQTLTSTISAGGGANGSTSLTFTSLSNIIGITNIYFDGERMVTRGLSINGNTLTITAHNGSTSSKYANISATAIGY